MRIPRVYINPAEQALVAGQRFELAERNAHYLSRVLRLRVGDSLYLFDGLGNEFVAEITAVAKRAVSVALGERLASEAVDASFPVCLACGVAKGERMDWLIQKATELGVSEILPLNSSRVEVRLDQQRAVKKLQHWQAVAVSAAEQCGRRQLPVLTGPQAFADFLQAEGAANRRDGWLHLVLDFNQPSLAELHRQLAEQQRVPAGVMLLSGPEGGLDDEELVAAEAAGFQPVSLGRRVLRAETAPLVGASLAQFLWGDLGS